MPVVTLRRVFRHGKELNTVRSLYRNAFPPEELFPAGILENRAYTGRGEYLAVYNTEGKCIGLAYVIPGGTVRYLFFFAIIPEERHQGYGHAVIDALRRRYPSDRILIALESASDENAPNPAERIRRHSFYESCGFRDLPYFICENGVTYASMSLGGPVQPQEYNCLAAEYMGQYYGRKYRMHMLPSSEGRHAD